MSLNNDPILTIEEVATLFKVSLSTLYGLVKTNTIPHFRIGKQLRFQQSELLKHFGYKISGSLESKDGEAVY